MHEPMVVRMVDPPLFQVMDGRVRLCRAGLRAVPEVRGADGSVQRNWRSIGPRLSAMQSGFERN